MTPVRAAFFDLGETLVGERRVWERWADRLGVPRPVLLAALEAAIERREHHRTVLASFRPGFDLAEQQARHDLRDRPDHELYELHPDALRCLERLLAAGLVVGVAGNQPQAVEAWLRQELPPGVLLASSASWDVEKPHPDFFRRVLDLVSLPAEQVAYVGDRVDNDVAPAAALGMRTVLVRRGPWGRIQGAWPEAERADHRVDDLDEAATAVLRLAGR